MSLGMTLDKKEIIYKVSDKGARLIGLESQLLGANEMKKIVELEIEEQGGFKQGTLSTRLVSFYKMLFDDVTFTHLISF